jgi:hypothetical protein
MWWLQLDNHKGSQPRCVALVNGSPAEVADRLTRLVSEPGVVISTRDRWFPWGIPTQAPDGLWDLTAANELKLSEPNELLRPGEPDHLKLWWLAHPDGANVPNWDLVSSCRIGERPGLLLVEAKAHDTELINEEKGKVLKRQASQQSFENHRQIGRVIADASAELQRATALPWALSRNSRYQMSNRFTTAWKLAQLGYSVVLVYLGFLEAHEMESPVRTPLASHSDWIELVLKHSHPLFPDDVWQRSLTIGKELVIPRIRSLHLDYIPQDLAHAP